MPERWHWHRTVQPEGRSWRLPEQCQPPADHCQRCLKLEGIQGAGATGIKQDFAVLGQRYATGTTAPPAALYVHSAALRKWSLLLQQGKKCIRIAGRPTQQKRLDPKQGLVPAAAQHALLQKVKLPYSCAFLAALITRPVDNEVNLYCVCSSLFHEVGYFQCTRCGASTGFKS